MIMDGKSVAQVPSQALVRIFFFCNSLSLHIFTSVWHGITPAVRVPRGVDETISRESNAIKIHTVGRTDAVYSFRPHYYRRQRHCSFAGGRKRDCQLTRRSSRRRSRVTRVYGSSNVPEIKPFSYRRIEQRYAREFKRL